MTVDETWLLLFDGECETCRRFAEKVKRFDTHERISILSLQDHYREDTRIPLEELKEELHLLGSSGTLLRGGEAIARIISLVPAARPFRWMIESRAGKKGSDLVYRILSRVRRCRSCGKTHLSD